MCKQNDKVPQTHQKPHKKVIIGFGNLEIFMCHFSYFDSYIQNIRFRIYTCFNRNKSLSSKQSFAFYNKLTIDNIIAEIVFLWTSTREGIFTRNLIKNSMRS